MHSENINNLSYYYFLEALKKFHYFLSKISLDKIAQKKSYKKQFKFIKTASVKNKMKIHQFTLQFSYLARKPV
jgi:hypothetical protein